jgi:hypothetical protein
MALRAAARLRTTCKAAADPAFLVGTHRLSGWALAAFLFDHFQSDLAQPLFGTRPMRAAASIAVLPSQRRVQSASKTLAFAERLGSW